MLTLFSEGFAVFFLQHIPTLAQAGPANSTDPGLFNTISIFLAVSGGVYAATTAIKSAHQDDVEGWKKESEKIFDDYSGAGEPKEPLTWKNCKCWRDKVVTWHKWWRSGYWVPIFTFLIMALFLVGHILIIGWNDPNQAVGAWHIYKWLIIVMVGIDLTCFGFQWTAWKFIERYTTKLRTIPKLDSADDVVSD